MGAAIVSQPRRPGTDALVEAQIGTADPCGGTAPASGAPIGALADWPCNAQSAPNGSASRKGVRREGASNCGRDARAPFCYLGTAPASGAPIGALADWSQDAGSKTIR